MTTEAQFLKLKEIFDSMKGVGQPFADVFTYTESVPEAFPVAIIESTNGLQRDEATNIKILENNFIIRCLFRQEDSAAAFLQRIQVFDRVYQELTKFGVADYLGNTATKMDIEHEFFVTPTASHPIFGVDFFIKTELVMEVA